MPVKARLYTSKNINRLFLSPYVEHIVERDHIVFRNDLFNQVVISPLQSGDPDEIITKLREGMEETEMLDYFGRTFTQADPAKIMAVFMQKGIIE